MKKTSKIKKLVTHDGPFHSDDIFACAVLSMILEKKKQRFVLKRTRDEVEINNADYVFDIGGVYDEMKNKFDHHQKGGAGKRDNGIEYASFGLVWKKFGPLVSGSSAIAKIVDEEIVAPIDADDNGVNLHEKIHEISPFLIQDFFKLMRPTLAENQKNYDRNFLESVKIAKKVLERNIAHAKEAVSVEQIITKFYKKTKNKKIVVLDKYYPIGKALDQFSEPLFVVFPRENKDVWVVKTVNVAGEDFISRKDFPAKWGGLQDEDLQKVVGVPEAVFCHKGLFLAVAKTKEGAIKLAQIAVES